MNYIELINRFWSIDLEANFTHLEVHLYFKLLEINNRLGWKESFKFPNSRLEAEVGSRPKNLINARQRLVDLHVISYRKGTTRDAGVYSLLSELQSLGGTKESNKGSNQGNNEKVIRGSLNKLNKTKEEKKGGVKNSHPKKSISERASDFKTQIWNIAKGTDYEDVEKLKAFWEYWSEHGENDKKMRFEKQTSFDIKRRLGTWWRNDKKFNGKVTKFKNESVTEYSNEI